jgi:alkylhydroperoxidase/carboxymuconolactone decarboxylase family protein YurZ
MKSSLEWSRNKEIANSVEKDAELQGKQGFDTEELKQDQGTGIEGQTLWKSEHLSDGELYALNEQLIGKQEQMQERIEKAEEEKEAALKRLHSFEKKFPDLGQDFKKEYRAKIDQYNSLCKEEDKLMTRNNQLVDEAEILQEVLRGGMSWDAIFTREEIKEFIEKSAYLKSVLEARERLYGTLKKFSLGLIRVNPEKLVFQVAAKELAWKRSEECTKEYDVVSQKLLQVRHEIQELSQWINDQRARPEFQELKNLTQSVNKQSDIINQTDLN